MTFDSSDLGKLAVLLDVDGTLLDIAPTPREVVVPRDLPATLMRLRDRLDGALAIVSGRPIGQIDEFFVPFKFAAIGGHGAEMRPVADGPTISGKAAPIDRAFSAKLKHIASQHPGVLIEDKGYSMALHYRLAPNEGIGLIHDVKHAFESADDRSYELLSGKAVLEIKRAGFNKGSAVRQLMTYPPFKGRRPLFIGDDVTDETVFAIMPDFNGLSFSVGRRALGVNGHFDAPSDVRDFLSVLARSDG